MDTCGTGCSAVCQPEGYHVVFLARIIATQHPMYQLDALNALGKWLLQLRGRLVHLFSDGATAVAIFKVGMGRDHFIQACNLDDVHGA